jgi:excisionase family DNA binding protein
MSRNDTLRKKSSTDLWVRGAARGAAMVRESRSDDEDQRLLTVDQLADRWQVSERTIRRMIKTKEVEVFRVGRAIRIHPDVANRGPKKLISK